MSSTSRSPGAGDGSRRCKLGGCLPWPHDMMPTVAAERGLYVYGVGCNRLHCPECDQAVRLDGDTWRCGCHERRNTEILYLERQPHDEWAPPELPWSCSGHPAPTAEDRAALGFTEDVLADVRRLLHADGKVAHHPKGYAGYGVDLRLDFEPDLDESAVQDVLVEALDGQDDLACRRAMTVLFHRDLAPLDGAVFRWNGLKDRLVPGSSVLTLGRLWVDGIARIARREGNTSQAWEEGLRLRRAGAGGKNSLLWATFPDED